MVFVPFTGIDNHNRCVTFGAGLISKENIESYKWLLRSFLKAFGEQPKIVVTDQDPAMKQAIEEVIPDSRHHLCMWHIMQKLTTKVTYIMRRSFSISCSMSKPKQLYASMFVFLTPIHITVHQNVAVSLLLHI